MRTLCITGYGKMVRKQGDLLVVESRNSEGKEKSSSPITPLDLDLILMCGDHAISTGALQSLLFNKIELIILDSLGNPVGYLLPCQKSPMIESFERQKTISPDRALSISRRIVAGAILNKVNLFRRLVRSSGLDLDDPINKLKSLIAEAEEAPSTGSLLGTEGSAARIYFEGLKMLIPPVFGFRGRHKNPPPDPVNSLLSYGYGILYARLRTACVSARLSPFYGVLHASYRNQESLVYDLIEEFRQPVIDRVVLTMLNRKELEPSQFQCSQGTCTLDTHLKKKYVTRILERCEEKVDWDGKTMTLSEVMDYQACKIAQSIFQGNEYTPFLYR